MDYGLLSILPPILAIALALIFRNVFIALFLGCLLGYIILAGGHLLQGIDDTLMSFITVFEDNDNTIVILLVAILGGLILLIEKSGGISGFVDYLTHKRSMIRSRRGANLFTWIVGLIVFTSGTLSNLVTGTISRPVSDAMQVSHEKLAYIVHSTSTPVCVLIPLSGWGAFMIGLIQAQGIPNGAQVLAKTIPLNFYCLLAVLAVLVFSLTGRDFGPMRKAEKRASEMGLLDEPGKGKRCDTSQKSSASEPRATTSLNLIVPIAIMVGMIIVGLFITGNGNLLEGDGMRAILWGIILSLFVAMLMFLVQRIFSVKEMLNIFFVGTGEMVSVASILIFAFSMGTVVKLLGAGAYLGSIFEGLLVPAMLPAIIFFLSCIISFSTGTSMGSMAVMMPLAMPIAMSMGIHIPLTAAAVFGGSIFGDHASPISDTTVLACVATGCDVMDHVRTQLPYAAIFGLIAFVMYLVAGFTV